ncbi:hypothetical protein Clacol_000982 [Clathrus columnatus]|uniref:P-loop containing nucleoside triphosphate hydrolase protein n=1 Tax=Clathrus columnatus TaxID=1419009 RepID=A0AAV5A2K0_9AGAM|nr:hypothetical protein Clacol_000982 [Clathrus columnatus]
MGPHAFVIIKQRATQDIHKYTAAWGKSRNLYLTMSLNTSDISKPGPPRVISLGLGRTGTRSLAFALEKLGFGPFHKMGALLRSKDPNQIKSWHNIGKGLATTDDVHALLDSYTSVLEYPAVIYPEEIYKAYPDAKYILSTRDPIKWEKSMKQTVLPALDILRENKNRNPWQQALFEWFEEDMLNRYHEGLLNNEETIQQTILVHNERIKKLIPAEKLLIYDISQGWDPLCKYLGVSKPDEPFPHENETAMFIERIFPTFMEQKEEYSCLW